MSPAAKQSRYFKGCLASLLLLIAVPEIHGKVYVVTQVVRSKGTPSQPNTGNGAIVKVNDVNVQFPTSYSPLPNATNGTSIDRMTLIRALPPAYPDGVSELISGRPNPRSISNAFHQGHEMPNSFGASDWLWVFGQFFIHDVSEVNSNDSRDIEVPPNDPFLNASVTSFPFARSNFILDSDGIAQQVSDMTSVIDGNVVYGSTATRLHYIRSDDSGTTGRLRTSGNNLLPKNLWGLRNGGGDDDQNMYLAGDVRVSENVALAVAHTLWVREHNYWADAIYESDPSLDGETIFLMARFMVQSEIQKIAYDEFFPTLIGHDAIPPYSGYNPSLSTGLENVVPTCVYRLGHSLVSPSLIRDYGNGTVLSEPLEVGFFAPELVDNEGGIDMYLRGFSSHTSQELDPLMVSAKRNYLFNEPLDLLSLNLQRGRDHGLPDFNTIRASLGLEKLSSFEDFTFSDELSSVYNDTDQIDCWIGMSAEPRLPGLMVGPSQRIILARNFANMRDGYKFYYKNVVQDPNLLALIESTTLADVIRRNSDSPQSIYVPDDVFHVPSAISQSQ